MYLRRIFPRLAVERYGIVVKGLFEFRAAVRGISLMLVNTGDDNDEFDWPWVIFVQIPGLELILHLPAPRRTVFVNGAPSSTAWEVWGIDAALGRVTAHWGGRQKTWRFGKRLNAKG